MQRWTRTARSATVVALLAAGAMLPLAPASNADAWIITITCKTPQADRQLSPSSCLNSTSDPTQTYAVTVQNASGFPVAGVRVRFTDNDPDAMFRVRTDVCETNPWGHCHSELKDDHPRDGELIHTTATIISTGASDGGKLTFTDDF